MIDNLDPEEIFKKIELIKQKRAIDLNRMFPELTKNECMLLVTDLKFYRGHQRPASIDKQIKYEESLRLIKLLKECEKLTKRLDPISYDFINLTINGEQHSVIHNIYEDLILSAEELASKYQSKKLEGKTKSLSDIQENQIHSTNLIHDKCKKLRIKKTKSYEIIMYITGIQSKSFIDDALNTEVTGLKPIYIKFGGKIKSQDTH